MSSEQQNQGAPSMVGGHLKVRARHLSRFRDPSLSAPPPQVLRLTVSLITTVRTRRYIYDVRVRDRRTDEAVRPAGDARREGPRHIRPDAVWRVRDSGEPGWQGDGV
jgi:hypothetical protein